LKLISINELEVGDILDQDIENDNGVVFAGTGTKVTHSILARILNLSIDFIYVKDENESIVEDSGESFSFEAEINKDFANTVESFKNVFMSAKFGQKIIVDEFKTSVKPLVNNIINNDNILGNLRSIKLNDAYTYKHSINVGLVSTMIGKWLGYNENDLADLVIAGMLHDIGKSKVPSSIIDKKGPLNNGEFEIIQSHVDFGFEVLSATEGINENIKLGVRHHHERFGGGGYQLGLKGENIHEFGRIIAIADIFDAMTSDRSYKSKISPFKVAEYIRELSFDHLDPRITGVFLRKIAHFYVGNKVKLNNGNAGEVILVNKSNYTKPLIRIGQDYVDLSKDYSIEIVDVI